MLLISSLGRDWTDFLLRERIFPRPRWRASSKTAPTMTQQNFISVAGRPLARNDSAKIGWRALFMPRPQAARTDHMADLEAELNVLVSRHSLV